MESAKPAVRAAVEPAPGARGWSRMPEAATQTDTSPEADAPEEGEAEWKILF
jgi:hypothetical protein